MNAARLRHVSLRGDADRQAIVRGQALPSAHDEDEVRSTEQWFLGYDSSCAACSNTAKQIEAASDGRIDVVSLADPIVHQWRTETLGPQAPWCPTLLRIHGGKVDAWTGAPLVARLSHLLGPRQAWKLAELIGEAKPSPSGQAGMVSRRRVLAGLSGVAAAVALAAVTADTAKAAQPDSSPAQCGVTYTDFDPYPTYYTLRDGYDTNGRYCPFLSSPIAAVFGQGVGITFRQYTYDGDDPDGSGDTLWYRTSGPTGCWVSDTRVTA